MIFPSRSLDTSDIKNYVESFASQRVRRIYLDELDSAASLPVGIATIKLIIEDEDTAVVAARELIDRTQREVNIEPQRRQLLELIETILVYKFPTMNRKEIESMFGLSDLKQTRVYQEGREEGREEGLQQGLQEGLQEGLQVGSRVEKFRIIPLLVRLGLSASEIAQELALSIEEVQQEIQKQPPQDDV